MFGYITVNKPELKLKDYDAYHAFYCGLCHSLAARYGRIGQLTLSYDMTFAALLLSALYEPQSESGRRFCSLHPTKKQDYFSNVYIDYAADMNVLLSYFSLRDNWIDEHDVKSRAMQKLLAGNIPSLKERYPRQFSAVAGCICRLRRAEDKKSTDIDRVAGLTGEMLSEILSPNDDEWSADLRRLGFFLGKFIYLMDAFEDREKDLKKGSYNIWNLVSGDYTDEKIADILNMMMSECALAFEALPIVKYADILRNIIYSGVWVKYDLITAKKDK